jgi:DNA polymerase
MSEITGDIESYSQISLKQTSADIYAKHPSTDVWFLLYKIDDGEVLVWRTTDPPPFIYANPVGHSYVWWNWTFDYLAIYQHILIPRYGFAPIPLEQQDSAQRLALANSYPAELGLCCEALGLPYKKDPEAARQCSVCRGRRRPRSARLSILLSVNVISRYC